MKRGGSGAGAAKAKSDATEKAAKSDTAKRSDGGESPDHKEAVSRSEGERAASRTAFQRSKEAIGSTISRMATTLLSKAKGAAGAVAGKAKELVGKAGKAIAESQPVRDIQDVGRAAVDATKHTFAGAGHHLAAKTHAAAASLHAKAGNVEASKAHAEAAKSHVKARSYHSRQASKAGVTGNMLQIYDQLIFNELLVNAAINQPRSLARGRYKRLNAGTGKGESHEAAQRGGIHLSDIDRMLGRDAAKQKATLGDNPPSWVDDEAAWDRAKSLADKGDYDGDVYWAVVSHIYQNITGNSQLFVNHTHANGVANGHCI
jgi:hypothetical protein